MLLLKLEIIVRRFDPLFAIFIGLSAAFVRVRREEKEKMIPSRLGSTLEADVDVVSDLNVNANANANAIANGSIERRVLSDGWRSVHSFIFLKKTPPPPKCFISLYQFFKISILLWTEFLFLSPFALPYWFKPRELEYLSFQCSIIRYLTHLL